MKLTTYEWVIETMAGDEVDKDARNRLDEFNKDDVIAALKGGESDGPAMRIMLVRNDEQGRSQAVVDDKRLPTHFSGAGGKIAAYVADKWHDELRMFRVTHLVG